MQEKNKNIQAILIFIFILVFSVTIIQLIGVGIDLLRRKLDLNNGQQIENISTTTKEQIVDISQEIIQEVKKEEKQEELTDYQYYEDLPKIQLASNTISWVNVESEPSKINGRVIKKFIKTNGQITNAYLYVNVSVDNGKKLKIWDSVYVSLQKIVSSHKREPVLDGHFYKSHTLKVPTSETSLYLFDLRQLPTVKKKIKPNEPVYSESRGEEFLDWLGMLKEANEFEFTAFLSTSRNGGMINEINIAYECSEATPECSLEIK